MKKQIVNNKVLKGVAIAMSAMMAITSVPFGSFAVEPETTETVEQAVTPADVINAVDKAEEEVQQHFEDTKKESQLDQAVLDELNQAEELLNKDELKNQDLVIAIVESEVLDQNVNALQESLASDYLQSNDKDLAGKARLHYDVARDENGNLETDENGNPTIGKSEAQLQLSGQYNSDYDNNKRSEQGVYQDGMKELQQAIKASGKGDEEGAKDHLAKAENYLNAANVKMENSTQQINEATKQYNAASDAYDKANTALQNIEAQLGDAINYSAEAKSVLEQAQKNVEKLEKMRDQYYGVLLQYYSEVKDDENVSIAVFDENGKLDVAKSAAAADELDNDIVNKGSGFSNDRFFELSRELLEQLVTYKLEDEGCTDIKFGATGSKTKNEISAVITSDKDGNDTISKYQSAGSNKWDNVSGVNGRNNHVTVTYKDKDGQPVTKYYNYIIKGKDKDFESDNTHFENGVIFVAEITKNGNAWSYTPYNANSTEFLDNYNSLVKAADDYKDAKAAVDAAAEKVKKLTEELNNVKDKVATNGEKLAELAEKLEMAQVAYENSKNNLQDFSDVYNQMRRNLYPEEFIEEEQEEVIPVTPDAPGTTGGTTDDGTADDSDDTADEGTGTTETASIPALPPAGAASAVAGVRTVARGGAAAGVLGARVDADDQAADNAVADTTQSVTLDERQTPLTATADTKTDEKKSVKIDNTDTPLAATPFEEGTNMNWLWLLVVAAAVIVTVLAYENHKKKVAANEEAKKYKKN